MILGAMRSPGGAEFIGIVIINLIIFGVVFAMLVCFVSSHKRIAKAMGRIANKLENDNKALKSND